MTNEKRLKRIEEIIESLDRKCMAAYGPVTQILYEITQSEISEIFILAKNRKEEAKFPKRDEIINQTKALCEKFIKKVETGRAHSKETYADCKALLEKIQG